MILAKRWFYKETVKVRFLKFHKLLLAFFVLNLDKLLESNDYHFGHVWQIWGIFRSSRNLQKYMMKLGYSFVVLSLSQSLWQ